VVVIERPLSNHSLIRALIQVVPNVLHPAKGAFTVLAGVSPTAEACKITSERVSIGCVAAKDGTRQLASGCIVWSRVPIDPTCASAEQGSGSIAAQTVKLAVIRVWTKRDPSEALPCPLCAMGWEGKNMPRP
jgi:hypothetical protein